MQPDTAYDLTIAPEHEWVGSLTVAEVRALPTSPDDPGYDPAIVRALGILSYRAQVAADDARAADDAA